MAGIPGKQIATGSRGVNSANIVDSAITTNKIAAGALSADAAGRAKIASGFFDSSTVSAKFASASIADAILAVPYIKADGTRAFTGGQSLGGFKLTNLGNGTAAGDVVNKGQLDAAVMGVDWHHSVETMYYIGTRTIAQIDALTPSAGWSVVAGSAGTPAAGTSDALAVGDVAEFDGTSWYKIVPNSGGFPPNDTSLVIAWPNTATLYSPLTDGTDEGKIAHFDGTSLTPATKETPSDGWAVLCAGAASNPPTAYNENKTFSFQGAVPTGSWQQISAAIPYAGVGELTTVNGGDTASAGTSANVARGDHQHAVATAAPGTIQPDDTATEGVSTSLARADHRHAIVADTPVAVGTTNAEGVSTSFARADHVHDSPAPTTGNKSMAALTTTADNDQGTSSTVAATPALDGYVQVFVNGIKVQVGNATKVSVMSYFSNDGGSTARNIANIAAGDTWHWNGSVAGYELDTNDVIDFDYEV